MQKFKELDLLSINELLHDDEKMIRDSVRKWVDDAVLPIIEEQYQKAEFPIQLVPQMGEMGLLGSNLPEKYGCAGINNVAYGLIMQELERGDSGLRSFASVQGAAKNRSQRTILQATGEQGSGQGPPSLAEKRCDVF